MDGRSAEEKLKAATEELTMKVRSIDRCGRPCRGIGGWFSCHDQRTVHKISKFC